MAGLFFEDFLYFIFSIQLTLRKSQKKVYVGIYLTFNSILTGLILHNVSFGCEPFPKRQILDSTKLKDFTDDNFKFDENGEKFSKRVENTVGKGEIARYEQFLLFPQCF